MSALHSLQTPAQGIHVIHWREFADAAARLAYAPVATDVGRVARQLDTGAFWLLSDDSPATWFDLTAVGTPPLPIRSALVFGNGSVSGTTTTRYLTAGFDAGTAPIAAVRVVAPFAGTVRNLRVRHNVPAGNGLAVVYTLRKNGVAQTLSVSMASTATSGSNLAASFTVVAGDTIDVEITKAASVGAAPGDVVATIEMESTS